MPLKLVRRPRSPCWITRETLRGTRVEESTGVDLANRPGAEEVRAKREAEILAESVYGRRAVVTFAEAAVSWRPPKTPFGLNHNSIFARG